MALGALLGIVTAAARADTIAVLAAGSLRVPLTDVAQAFEQASGHSVAARIRRLHPPIAACMAL